MQKIAISIGDLNGIGLEIALNAHDKIKEFVDPIYSIDEEMLEQGCKLLNIKRPENFNTVAVGEEFKITPSKATRESGINSYKSFLKAVDLVRFGEAEGLVTLPINKLAWNLAEIRYRGHTELFDHIFGVKSIMMMGCKEVFVIFHTHHIPLRDVSSHILIGELIESFKIIGEYIKDKKIGVLALNPHAGENGVIGDEEGSIKIAISRANKLLNRDVFEGVLVPDSAFIDIKNSKYKYFVCMYHDQCLPTIKALFFDRIINVTLGIPIIRASVGHGTAYNIAYKNKNPSVKSYIEAAKYVADKIKHKT